LVLTSNAEKFATRFPNVTNRIGDFDFGLSSKGEFIRLFDSEGGLVDSVFYLPDNGWPEAANGGGPSLELNAPENDNTLAENWVTYTSNGTPGRANGVYTSNTALSQLEQAIQVSPNPFQELVHVNLTLSKPSRVAIDLLNLNGQLLRKLRTGEQLKTAQLTFSIPNLPAGTYLISVRVDGMELVKKVVKM